MFTYTDVNADDSSRQHNGNNYNYHYYGASPQGAGASRPPRQPNLSGNSSLDNGLKLWRAVRTGQLPRVRYLLKSGADFTYRCDKDGTTPLHQAALVGHTDVLEALLAAGASIDDEDGEGATALHYAAQSIMVVILVMAGADVDHEDHAGRTPGCRARERSNMGVVKALLDNHADASKIKFTIGDGDGNGPTIQGSQDIGQARLKEHSESKLALAQTAANLITPSTTDDPSNTNLNNAGPERKLVIGISLETGLHVAAYALADRQILFGWHIRESLRTTGPTKRPKPVDYGIESDFKYFGFVLDPDTPGRAGPKAGLIRQQLQATNKTAEGAVALFIRALHNYIVEVFASEDPDHSLDNLQSEVIVTSPPNWSEKSRIAITQAAGNNGLYDVALIKAAEAAVLYTLHCASDKHAAVGNVLLVCELQEGSVSCTGEQVISLKPFQLKQLGPAKVVHRRPQEEYRPRRKINLPFYHTKTPAEEHRQSFLDQNTQWREDIRNCIAEQVRLLKARSKQLGQNDVEAIHLVGSIGSIYPRDFAPLLAGIEEDNPGINVMHRRRQMANEPSVLGAEVVMYGLLKNVGEN